MHDVPGPSQVKSLFGTFFFFAGHILLYIGSINPLSCVPSYSFRPDLPLCASIPSSTLAFCHRASSHPHRPCARRLALGYNSLNCLQFKHHFLLPMSPRGSVAGKTAYTFLPFPLISPSTHLARSVLVPTALDSRITPPFAYPCKRQTTAALFSPSSLLARVISTLARPIADKPS